MTDKLLWEQASICPSCGAPIFLYLGNEVIDFQVTAMAPGPQPLIPFCGRECPLYRQGWEWEKEQFRKWQK